MQWTRDGAHNVLQIRALMESNEWEENWLNLVLPEEVIAALKSRLSCKIFTLS
jgi:hypothetical protein